MSADALSLTSEGLACVACALLLAASAQDLAARVVANGLSLAIAFVGLALQVAQGRVLASLATALGVFVIAALCWRRGWMGGGDVKLLAASALLVPPALVPGLVFAVAMAGGVLALLYLLLGRMLPPPSGRRPATRLGRILRIEQRRIRRRVSLPYASAIAAGALFILLTG
jgi:prepilin peptidase CpaA